MPWGVFVDRIGIVRPYAGNPQHEPIINICENDYYLQPRRLHTAEVNTIDRMQTICSLYHCNTLDGVGTTCSLSPCNTLDGVGAICISTGYNRNLTSLYNFARCAALVRIRP